MKKLSKLVLAAMVVAVAGCGGSSSTIGTGNKVNVNGGISTGTATSVLGADATAGPVPISFSDGTVGILASGVIPPGGTCAIIPKGASLISNLRFSDGLKPTRADRQVFLSKKNGVATQEPPIGTISNTLTAGVTLDSTIAFPTTDGNYEILLKGPFSVVSGNNTLSIRTNIFVYFEVKAGVMSLPAAISGQLPANGGSTFGDDISLDITVPSAFGDRAYELTILFSGRLLQKRVTASDAKMTFTKLTDDSSAGVPSNGINSIRFGIVTPIP